MSRLLQVLSVCAVAASPLRFGVPAAFADLKPNILLIFVDDLGYGELGCQGNPQIPTPHIDSLAESGVRCTSGYVTASYCSPSRAGLLTGRFQTRFGYELNPVGRHNLDPQAGLPVDETTLADLCSEAGYATGLVGKWHLGGTDKFHPQQRGFEEFYGFLHEGHYYVPPPYKGVTSFLRIKSLPEGVGPRLVEGDTVWSTHLGYDEPPYDADNPLLRDTEPLVEPAYLTDAFTREAVAFIERHKREPFFLYLSYNAVHSPMQATKQSMKEFAAIEDLHRRVFAGMLSSLDDGVGKVLAKLRTERLEEQTLVFFISDNGGPTRELTSSNAPLRGGKGTLYEGGVRVPFLLSWKGRLPPGIEYAHPVVATDVLATMAAAIGAEIPADRQLDSANLLPYLRGERDGVPHKTIYWRMGDRAALRHGDWKLVRPRSRGRRSAPWELYDLRHDLAESENLARHRPEQLAELVRRYGALDAQMVEPVWRPSRR